MKQPINIVVNTDNPQFVSWLAGCQNLINTHYAQNLPRLLVPNLVPHWGTRFVKIVEISQEVDLVTKRPIHSSAWAFIDRTNGNVLKPATWNAPAKHARGNLFDGQNGLGSIGPHGPAYLR